MVKLEGYGNLAKKQEDLLKVGYVFAKLFSGKFVTKADSGLEVTARAGSVAKPGSLEFLGSSTFSYTKGDGKLTLKTNSSSDFRATAEYKPKDLVKDLKLKAEAKANTTKQTSSGSVTAEYVHQNVIAKLTLTDGPTVKTQVVAGKDGLGVGFDSGFNFATNAVTAYNLALFWYRKHQRVVAKHNTNDLALGQFALSIYHKQSPNSKFGAHLVYPWSGTPKINFGGWHQLNNDTELRAKVTSDGKVAGSFKQTLNEHVKVTVAAEVNTLKLSPSACGDLNFGVKLNLS